MLRNALLALGVSIMSGRLSAQGIDVRHDAPACIVAGQFPRLDACVSGASDVARGRVHFRAESGQHWYYVELEPEGSCFRAVLPKPTKSARRVRYYIEVADRSFGEGRTPEHAPEVVARAGECRKDLPIGAGLASATVTIVASAGAPAIPVGFSAAGVVAGQAAAAGAAAGAGASTGGGISGTSLGLIGGGLAAAAGVAVAASGGKEADPRSVDDDGDGFSEVQGDCNDADPAIKPGGGFQFAADFPWSGAVSCTPTPRPYSFTIRNDSCSPLDYSLTGTWRRRDAFSDTTSPTPARSGSVPPASSQSLSLQFGLLANPQAFRCCSRSGVGTPCSQVFRSSSIVVEETVFTLGTGQGSRSLANSFSFDESQCPAC